MPDPKRKLIDRTEEGDVHFLGLSWTLHWLRWEDKVQSHFAEAVIFDRATEQPVEENQFVSKTTAKKWLNETINERIKEEKLNRELKG